MPLVITLALLAFMLAMLVLFCLHSGRCEEQSRNIHRLRDFARVNPRFLQ